MDFSWFGTIPGMLITGGIALLIIALIIFISTIGRKNKGEKSKVQEQSLEGAKQMVNEATIGQNNESVVAMGVAGTTPSVQPQIDNGMPDVTFAVPDNNSMGMESQVTQAVSGIGSVEPQMTQPVPET
ncbi:MAG: hypothetical protein Q4E39_06515, partial [bacterium]|nr:hypothetical protein [bacterium]